MGPDNVVKAVVLAELRSHVRAERNARAAFAGSPPGHRVRIAPQHLMHQPGLWDVTITELFIHIYYLHAVL